MDTLMSLFWLLAAWLGGADDDAECLLLGGLDVVRTEAFVTGEVDRLGDVYVDERAARADAEVLRSYRARGLRLAGMVLVRASCRVAERSRHLLALDVVDHLGPTWVQTADGRRRDLPRDRPTRRVVVLERVGGVWRVASIRSGERGLQR